MHLFLITGTRAEINPAMIFFFFVVVHVVNQPESLGSDSALSIKVIMLLSCQRATFSAHDFFFLNLCHLPSSLISPLVRTRMRYCSVFLL